MKITEAKSRNIKGYIRHMLIDWVHLWKLLFVPHNVIVACFRHSKIANRRKKLFHLKTLLLIRSRPDGGRKFSAVVGSRTY